MSSYPLPTLACTVSSTGITAPAVQDILNSIVVSLQSIFGSDVLLTADTQDMQMLGVFASAMNDGNSAVIAAYNNFNPNYSQGVGQDTTYKINGIQREASTNSTAPLLVIGVAGTVINFGIAQDTNGNLWNLPSPTTIPLGGAITVTGTAQAPGDVAAPSGIINIIYTQVLGWQSVLSTSDAVPGSAVETDGEFRVRQTISTSITSITPLQAIAAAIANLTGVSRSIVYENSTNAYGTGANNIPVGVPPHSICAVVEGGALTAIAQLIEQTKSPGTGTFGTTTELVYDPSGVPIDINFFVLALEQVFVTVNITPLSGYNSTTAAAIAAALLTFINDLKIGATVYYNWMFGPASLYGSGLEFTFSIASIFIGTSSSPSGTSDIPIAFNQAAITQAANIVVND